MSLAKADPQIAGIIQAERRRQAETLEMIASENHASAAVLEAMANVLTDKYAEGYPGKRWYCGNVNADAVERLAIDRAKQVFGAEYANVQPHSGTNANLAVYLAALKPGKKIMAMSLAHGGHLSHGRDINLSGICYKVASYGVREDTETFDFDAIRAQARKERPDLLVVGASAYPRTIDFATFGAIAKEVGCPMMSDIAHIAGLIVGGVHPDPVPHSDFVTATTHKTLRGPRGGLILCRAEWGKAIDMAVFPGMQGGPLLHAIAAKAVALLEAARPEFKGYAAAIVANAGALAEALLERGWRLVSGGTDNHLLLVDLRNKGISGAEAADMMEVAGMVVNKNLIPNDPTPPAVTSGIRPGTPGLTTRGMKEPEMALVGKWIARVVHEGKSNPAALDQVRGEVEELCAAFPIYMDL